MGVDLEDLTVLRVDYIWLSAEIYAEKLCSSILATNYVGGHLFYDVVEHLRAECNDEPPDSAYPPGATDEDQYIFNDRFGEYMRERVEELEQMEAEYIGNSKPELDELVTIDIRALQKMVDDTKGKRRIGFIPE